MRIATAKDTQVSEIAYMPILLQDQLERAGVRFKIWQPNAKQVCVVGPFNGWDGTRHVMVEDEGYWTLWIPDFPAGAEYGYEVTTLENEAYLKSAAQLFPSAFRRDPAPSRRMIL